MAHIENDPLPTALPYATLAVSLETDKIDAIFWTSIVLNPDNPAAYSDVPEGTIYTECYYESPFCTLTTKGQ